MTNNTSYFLWHFHAGTSETSQAIHHLALILATSWPWKGSPSKPVSYQWGMNSLLVWL